MTREPANISALIAAVEQAGEHLREQERATAAAREELAVAIRAAADGGVQLALLARSLGLSRQRVSDIAKRT